MKIVIVPSWFPTVENQVLGSFFLEQAKALANAGHEVTVLYPEIVQLRHLKKKLETSIKKEKVDGLEVYRKKVLNIMPQRFSQIRSYLFTRELEKLLNAYRDDHGEPHFLHAHSWIWAGYSALVLKTKFSYKIIVTEHSSKVLMNTYTPFELESYKKTISQADHIIAVGPTLKERLEELAKKQVENIPNSVSKEFVDFPISLNTHSSPKSFVTVSFLTKNKQLDKLITAFSEVYKGRDTKLTIVGDGPEYEHLVELVKSLSIESQVIFLGRVNRSDVPRVVGAADVYVSASKIETFGVAIIEALALGLPVIAYNSGGPALSVNAQNGILLEDDAVESFIRAFAEMEQIYKNFDRETIRQQCLERFGEQAIVRKLEKIYSNY